MSTTNNDLVINEVLIKKAIEGDESAFRTLYNTISGKMYSLCLRYAVDSEEANDFFHDGFIKLYRHLKNYKAEGSFEGWARRIFVTTCLDKKKRRKIIIPESELLPDPITIRPEIYEKLSMNELMELIMRIPPFYRSVVNLFFIENYTHKEIGQLLGISEIASRSRISKARTYLKEILSGINVE